ncbi:nitrilase-related carbon-nitrogen hydrolase [Marinicella rhabdoformis]|uniref:nitrilase-related carbon-nitrogen hydrolase n=1 Tax=Marinicella rhabdoformis TaxID=2580566 RepID=UPI0012AED5B0|nr:nitrilase-related carbon-nitrogen hydrolase [Marinicella rhabdoformis]
MNDKTLNIAAVQYDIQWLDKAANFAKLESMIRDFFSGYDGQVDLLLLPETFSTGFCLDDASVKEPEDGGEDLLWLKKMANKYNCVVAGSVFVEHHDKKANRFYWVSPEDHVKYYDKRHLFRLGNEGGYVAQGMERKVFEIKGIRILPQVCYDLRFPVFQRNVIQRNVTSKDRSDYDVMVNVANWPAVRRNVWDTLLKARAMENQAYVIGVNRVGDDGKGVAHSGGTCVIDFKGEPLVQAEDDKQQVISWSLDMSALVQFKKDFPAYLDADDFKLK